MLFKVLRSPYPQYHVSPTMLAFLRRSITFHPLNHIQNLLQWSRLFVGSRSQRTLADWFEAWGWPVSCIQQTLKLEMNSGIDPPTCSQCHFARCPARISDNSNWICKWCSSPESLNCHVCLSKSWNGYNRPSWEGGKWLCAKCWWIIAFARVVSLINRNLSNSSTYCIKKPCIKNERISALARGVRTIDQSLSNRRLLTIFFATVGRYDMDRRLTERCLLCIDCSSITACII